MATMTMGKALNAGLRQAMLDDDFPAGAARQRRARFGRFGRSSRRRRGNGIGTSSRIGIRRRRLRRARLGAARAVGATRERERGEKRASTERRQVSSGGLGVFPVAVRTRSTSPGSVAS